MAHSLGHTHGPQLGPCLRLTAWVTGQSLIQADFFSGHATIKSNPKYSERQI
jgi:hypothetical protein